MVMLKGLIRFGFVVILRETVGLRLGGHVGRVRLDQVGGHIERAIRFEFVVMLGGCVWVRLEVTLRGPIWVGLVVHVERGAFGSSWWSY